MHWFKDLGPVYLPVSVLGWLVTIACVGFCVQVCLAIDVRSHSVSDTLYGVFPFWVPTFLLWAFIAGRTSPADAG
jgi:hypothetical protein